MSRQPAGDDRPLPARRPPHRRAAHPRHPARPRRLRLRDASPGAVAARARRRPGARPGVARRARARSRVRSSGRSTRASSIEVSRELAAIVRAGPPAGEAPARAPVHREHDHEQGSGCSATRASRSTINVDGFGDRAEQDLQVRRVHRRDGPLQRRVQAVLRGGHEPHDARATSSRWGRRRTSSSTSRRYGHGRRRRRRRRDRRGGRHGSAASAPAACGVVGIVCLRRGASLRRRRRHGLGDVVRRRSASVSASVVCVTVCTVVGRVARRRRSSSSWGWRPSRRTRAPCPVSMNAAIAKPMTPVTSPSDEPRAPARACADGRCSPRARTGRRRAAGTPAGRPACVPAAAGGRPRATALRRSTGWRSASPTMPTMTGVMAAPTMAPPCHTLWTTSAAASDDRLAMTSV